MRIRENADTIDVFMSQSEAGRLNELNTCLANRKLIVRVVDDGIVTQMKEDYKRIIFLLSRNFFEQLINNKINTLRRQHKRIFFWVETDGPSTIENIIFPKTPTISHQDQLTSSYTLY